MDDEAAFASDETHEVDVKQRNHLSSFVDLRKFSGRRACSLTQKIKGKKRLISGGEGD
jgi:hypothetical protein